MYPREKLRGFSGIADLEANLIKEEWCFEKSQGKKLDQGFIYWKEVGGIPNKILGIVYGYGMGKSVPFKPFHFESDKEGVDNTT